MIIELKDSTTYFMTFQVSDDRKSKEIIVSAREYRINGQEKLIDVIKAKFERDD